MKRFLIIPAVVSTLVSCGGKSAPEETMTLASPSEVTVSQLSKTSAKVVWKDNSEGETGFSIFLTQDKAEVSDSDSQLRTPRPTMSPRGLRTGNPTTSA